MLFKILSFTFLALLFSYSLFAQDNRPILSGLPGANKPTVEIIYLQEEKPINAIKMGEIILSQPCGIAELLDNAKYQAVLKGGDAIYITSLDSSAPGEDCYRIEAKVYKLQEPYISKPNTDYPFDKITTKKDGEIILTEILPQFPGGVQGMLKFLKAHVRYPASAFRNNISGTVVVKCVVDKTGKLNEIAILDGVDQALDQEAVRVISQMPEWSPGFQNGKAVPVRYTIPIRFDIQGKAARKK